MAVWGCGPVGYFAIQSAWLQGASRVIAIDYESTDDLVELLKQMTGGRGPDVCIDAVGLEAHGHDLVSKGDWVKQALRLEMTGRRRCGRPSRRRRRGGG